MNTATIEQDEKVKAQVERIQAFCLQGEGGEETLSDPEELHLSTWSELEWQYVSANRLAVPMVLEKGPDGYTATTPVLKGCIAEGDTIEEAVQDFKEALNSLLAAYASEHRAVPWRAEPLRLGEVNTRELTVLI